MRLLIQREPDAAGCPTTKHRPPVILAEMLASGKQEMGSRIRPGRPEPRPVAGSRAGGFRF
jgi:hypothetical protein